MKLFKAAAALAFATLLSIHHPARAADDWQAVIDAAKKEGTVTLYSTQLGQPFQDDVIKLFEAKYGIHVQLVALRTNEIRERIRADQIAGKAGADISYNGSTTSELQMEEGRFQSFGTMPAVATLLPDFKSDGTLLPVSIQGYGIMVNTRTVKPEDEPKSWSDLLDPKWKGKILSADQRVLGDGGVFFYVMYEKFGREFHEKLAGQQMTMSRELRENERRVARGEFPLYIPLGFPNMTPLKGLPIKAIIPKEGIPYIVYVMAMLKDAAHPNAARLLMNYFIEKESAMIYAKGGFRVPVSVPVEQLDAYAQSVTNAKLLGTTDVKKINGVLDIAKEIYK